MAKNAKLTIVEVHSVRRGFVLELMMGLLMSGREYRSCWFNLPERHPFAWYLCRPHCTSYHREARRNADPSSAYVG
jgi:hypothetical protein